jgi:Inner membrane protein YgaP-like, transmembrane domain
MSYRNLSTLDRAIRVALGLLMLAAGWAGLTGGVWKVALEIFGWVPLITGLIGWCPIYALLGLNTRRPGQEAEDR